MTTIILLCAAGIAYCVAYLVYCIKCARLPDAIGAAVLCLLAGGTLAICFL
ncbi:MAG: hypothetical protein KIC63_11245 [Clostridium sp.]|nr:hypothetical protein [Clostridium sp.]